MDTQFESIWINRLSDSLIKSSPAGPLLTICMTLGLLPTIPTALFILLNSEGVSEQFVIFQGLAMMTPIIGTILIWQYQAHVYPTFIERATSVTPYTDNQELQHIAQNFNQFFVDKYIYTVSLWLPIVCGACVYNIGYWESQGVTGYGDPTFILYLLFAAWFAVITGVGLHMGLTTILCIRKIGELEFSIDPLHPDGLGGLSPIGYFAISTTTLLATGSLSLPLGFAIAAAGDVAILLYAGIGIYISTIILSFVYPTFYINRRAKEIRERIVNQKRQQIKILRTEIMEADDESDVDLKQAKLSTLRNEFNDYNRVNLYPMSLFILSRLVSSVILPLFFIMLEVYVFK